MDGAVSPHTSIGHFCVWPSLEHPALSNLPVACFLLSPCAARMPTAPLLWSDATGQRKNMLTRRLILAAENKSLVAPSWRLVLVVPPALRTTRRKTIYDAYGRDDDKRGRPAQARSIQQRTINPAAISEAQKETVKGRRGRLRYGLDIGQTGQARPGTAAASLPSSPRGLQWADTMNIMAHISEPVSKSTGTPGCAAARMWWIGGAYSVQHASTPYGVQSEISYTVFASPGR